MCLIILILAALQIAPLTAAQSQNTSSTQPEAQSLVGWTSGPDQRGTMSIIWNCLATIIACTWTIHHLNVPKRPLTEIRGITFDSSVSRWIPKFLRDLRWMFFTVIVPEFILSQAWDEVWSVRKVFQDLKALERNPVYDLADERLKTSTWTKGHCFYANMGGLRMPLDSDTTASDGGVPQRAIITSRPPPPEQELKALHAAELCQLWKALPKEGGRHPPPPIHTTDIDGMTKRDNFSKLIAYAQIVWYFISVATRWIRGLPIPQLELLTVVFAVCALFTYIMRWNKPQNVELWTEISPKTYDTEVSVEDFVNIQQPRRFFSNDPEKGGGKQSLRIVQKR
ncbi:hypothetical protein CDD80_1766 [Ophiocordyceps camponoti-rufipedis]|uniref:Uncharacterized protein n=1 Tax=Ophiocordyceps camponoti-rufipedis TaxID=2004952 RepID=A0A2C5XWJ3_9HYPO|nr:hypothetical protein CDD80_1766 [Ophiocordyceps camponoti-rufipedis]